MFEFFKPLTNAAAANLSPVTLAFVGDAVYSLYVRQKLVLESDVSTGKLQFESSKVVSAHGQNGLLHRLQPLFTEEELAIFKRGRNAKKPTRSKNADVVEYNNSTGLEAVLGWLYLSGQSERLNFLLEERQ